eukprot:6963897-Lingulodinium_polyedra.AAC.1
MTERRRARPVAAICPVDQRVLRGITGARAWAGSSRSENDQVASALKATCCKRGWPSPATPIADCQ